MTTPYEQMNFRERAMYHVAQAENDQAVATILENKAKARGGNAQMASYLLAHDQELAFPYKQATGNRNAHQQQAIMYGIMAMLERLYK